MNDCLIPWERRRRVPWSGLDVLALFLLYIVLIQYGAGATQLFREPPPPITESVATTEHPLSQLVKQDRGAPLVWLVVLFSAIVAAPLGEEFFFRLVLQGWLEKQESFRFKRRILPHGLVSVVFSSLIFAILHGGARKEQTAETLFYSLLGIGIANVCFMVLGIVFLRFGRKATWSDLGLRFHRLPTDLGAAAILFVLFVPPIIFIHVAIQQLFPGIVTDPIPLFFFAVVLGFLFYRTRRLAGCILLHAMLNGASFTALAIGVG